MGKSVRRRMAAPPMPKRKISKYVYASLVGVIFFLWLIAGSSRTGNKSYMSKYRNRLKSAVKKNLGLKKKVEDKGLERSAEDLEAHNNKSALEADYKPFINGVALIRIHEGDKHKWTKKDVRDWIYYHLHSGINHLYIYDHYDFAKRDFECLQQTIEDMKLSSKVTYHDFSRFNYGSFSKNGRFGDSTNNTKT